MINVIDVKEGVRLKDYDLYSSLAMPLRELMQEAGLILPKIKSKKIWMVNSTAQGGGVAEMMPRLVSLFRQLGITCDWVVATTDRKGFFDITKKIHNLIHGESGSVLTESDKFLYDEVNRENAEHLLQLIKPDDIIIIHDPQPMGMAIYIKEHIPVKFIWRCHIGLDKHSLPTETAWEFLKPYAGVYSIAVFSAPEYIPAYLAGKSIIMHPTIDPLDHKNRDLPIHKVVGILCNSNIVTEYHPVLTPPFVHSVKRLQPDGSFQSPLRPTDMGILFKPVILQISRWDRLKGFLPLMQGFALLKENMNSYADSVDRNLRKLQLAQLVLAGPDPDFVDDDPEGHDVLKELTHYYCSLHPSIQAQIAILKLPMFARKENELIVNALQRIATIIVQNSLKEGFGLTVTEALWKIKPVIGTYAYGIRQQIHDNLNGILIQDPLNKKEIAGKLNYSLARPKEREVWGYSGQKRVIENFLVFTQIRKWLQLFASF
jgi:trehalose synthase